MPEQKRIVNFRLSEDDNQYLCQIAQKHNTNKTHALEIVLREHRSQADGFCEALSEKLLDEFDKRYGNQLTHVRLSTNYTDRNTQVLLEMFNTMLYSFKLTAPVTSSKAKNPIWTESEKDVSLRIARYKQLNDEKKKKKQGAQK